MQNRVDYKSHRHSHPGNLLAIGGMIAAILTTFLILPYPANRTEGATTSQLSNCPFVIYFFEGYNEERPDELYGARVEVFREGEMNTLIPVCEVKGSTLPNAYWYYKCRDAAGRDQRCFNDGKLQEAMRRILDTRIPLGNFEALRELLSADKEWPVVCEGTYTFEVMRSQSLGKALRVQSGNFVPTLFANPNQGNKRIADGIWIHKGLANHPNRGSEGCLTIAPSDWDSFIGKFPDPKEWKDKQYEGRVIINRNKYADSGP